MLGVEGSLELGWGRGRGGRMKQGANGRVTFCNGIATKTLKSKIEGERGHRFKIEIDALSEAREAGIPNIVPILSHNLESSYPSYTMLQMHGDLDIVLPYTQNNPKQIAKLTLPLVNALSRLYKLPKRIIHRDLKPSNILVKKEDELLELYLADFGCAFIQDENSQRLTEDHRAVGATLFRAPEYTHGRVEEVTSAADIFSIGKLLWYLCNGHSLEVFPYTLWFPEQYNLSLRCNNTLVPQLNLIVANCVQIRPESRLSYEALASLLKSILDENIKIGTDDSKVKRLKMRVYESKLEIELQVEQEQFLQLLLLLTNGFKQIANEVRSLFSETSLASTSIKLENYNITIQQLAYTVVQQKSDMLLGSWETTHFVFNFRGLPKFVAETRELDGCNGPYVQISYQPNYSTPRILLNIFPTVDGVMVNASSNKSAVPYSIDILREFFFEKLDTILA